MCSDKYGKKQGKTKKDHCNSVPKFDTNANGKHR